MKHGKGWTLGRRIFDRIIPKVDMGFHRFDGIESRGKK